MGADSPGWVPPQARTVRAVPVVLTLMDQACTRRRDVDLGNRLAAQAFGLLGRGLTITNRLTAVRMPRTAPGPAMAEGS